MADQYANSVTDAQGRLKTPGQKGRGHDESGALAVQERMEKANLGGGTIDASVPKPDRSKFAAGLGGEAEYQKAYRAWQQKALKSPAERGQKKALSGM